MLRRAENVSATWQRGVGWLFTGRGYMTVTIGRETYRRPGGIRKTEWKQMVALSDDEHAVRFIDVLERQYWRFGGRWYWDNEELTPGEVRALLVTRRHARRAQINRAQTIAAMSSAPVPAPARGAIPDDLRLLVWNRDGGACRQCGSSSELQYDHIIPWSVGGATSEENLQLLCGPCNRRKGASVASPGRPTTGSGAATPSSGWYPDPSGAPGRRYWDGSTWTPHTAP